VYTDYDKIMAYHSGRPTPVGKLVFHYLTTPMVEVAEDGQTAKGVWIAAGVESGLMSQAQAAQAPEFLFEKGEKNRQRSAWQARLGALGADEVPGRFHSPGRAVEDLALPVPRNQPRPVRPELDRHGGRNPGQLEKFPVQCRPDVPRRRRQARVHAEARRPAEIPRVPLSPDAAMDHDMPPLPVPYRTFKETFEY
jgi:hypothetical protein